MANGLEREVVDRRLHDYPGIPHRDLSVNTMCRIIEKVNAKEELERCFYGALPTMTCRRGPKS